MAEALALVKNDLGPRAVVLHTRTYKRGGVLGLGAKPVVEVTAADGRQIGQRKRQEATRSPRAQALRQARASNVTVATPAQQQTAGDLIRRTYQAARAEFEPAPTASPAVVDRPAVVATPRPDRSIEQEQLMGRELAAVRDLVQQVVANQHKAQAVAEAPELPDPLVEHYTTLIQQEVACELAHELVRKIDPQTVEDVPQALRDEVAKMLPTDDSAGALVAPPEGGPRVIALVGPTGVGKTTTVAKLAATFKLKQNKRVGLITADTYRIAAVDQLRTYAGIIGLPLEVVANPEELREAMVRLADCDVIILDTAGRSQRDAGRLDELAQLVAAAKPHETHLVLSSTASQRVLLEIIERFSQIKTDRILFTKLDEAVTCGVLLNVVRQVKKPLSYITTGQEVPHQIEAGCSKRLAEMVLGQGVLS